MKRKQLLSLFTCIVIVFAMTASLAAQAKKGGKAAPAAKAPAPAAAAAAPKAEGVANVASNPDAMDLNAAPLEKLMTLTGVDIVVAKKIAAGRPYKDKRDLVAKKIMTPEAFNRIAKGIVVKTPDKPATGKKG